MGDLFCMFTYDSWTTESLPFTRNATVRHHRHQLLRQSVIPAIPSFAVRPCFAISHRCGGIRKASLAETLQHTWHPSIPQQKATARNSQNFWTIDQIVCFLELEKMRICSATIMIGRCVEILGDKGDLLNPFSQI